MTAAAPAVTAALAALRPTSRRTAPRWHPLHRAVLLTIEWVLLSALAGRGNAGAAAAPVRPALRAAAPARAASSGSTAAALGSTSWHVCTQIRSDARFLMEWIEFTSLMGATSFTIYDHSSRDSAELGPVIAAYTGAHTLGRSRVPDVEVIGWPPHTRVEGEALAAQRHWLHPKEATYMREGLDYCRRAVKDVHHNPIGCQIAAKADCLARHSRHHSFLSFHDTDEFFFSSAPSVIGALQQLKRQHPAAQAVYMPSITFGSMRLQRLPPGALVVETLTRRAPFEELGDAAAKITASIRNCSLPTTSFPDRTLCTVDHGKHIYTNRSAVFVVDDGPTKGFMERFQNVPFVSLPLSRVGPVRLLHYQHRGLADLAARGKLWGKSLNVEQAEGAPDFWNAVEDRTVAGNATLVRLLRRNTARRLARLESAKSCSMRFC